MTALSMRLMKKVTACIAQTKTVTTASSCFLKSSYSANPAILLNSGRLSLGILTTASQETSAPPATLLTPLTQTCFVIHVSQTAISASTLMCVLIVLLIALHIVF